MPGSELASKATSIAVAVAPVFQSSVKCTIEPVPLKSVPYGGASVRIAPHPMSFWPHGEVMYVGLRAAADGSRLISSMNVIGIVPPVDHDCTGTVNVGTDGTPLLSRVMEAGRSL